VAALATIACHGPRPADDHAARAPRRRARTHPGARGRAAGHAHGPPRRPAPGRAPADCWPAARPHLTAPGPVHPFADVEEARALRERDPAVQAASTGSSLLPWMVPAGAMTFSPTTFPRSTPRLPEPDNHPRTNRSGSDTSCPPHQRPTPAPAPPRRPARMTVLAPHCRGVGEYRTSVLSISHNA
jgi:hypothetical protein